MTIDVKKYLLSFVKNLLVIFLLELIFNRRLYLRFDLTVALVSTIVGAIIDHRQRLK